ncbi:MAG: acyl carrier protein [Gammaproteobacteria bacterium]|nr:acyl carrier protein [Gammaproteobacteria bacterium]MDH5692018.1 acyl carrier protein [Gammaproteobacteria bacterium]
MNETVIEIVSEVFGVDEDDVSESSSPETIDNWDSMNHLKLVTAIEEEFSINLSMSEIESITDVKSLMEVVASHTK